MEGPGRGPGGISRHLAHLHVDIIVWCTANVFCVFQCEACYSEVPAQTHAMTMVLPLSTRWANPSVSTFQVEKKSEVRLCHLNEIFTFISLEKVKVVQKISESITNLSIW